MDKNSSSANEFASALREHAPRYDVQLGAQAIARLQDYYEQVTAWNARLHLVAPCSAAEFATRHVLESLLAPAHIREGARIVDVGSGSGLPIIPCLIVRPDLSATLIESSPKKAVFLREALRRVGAHERAQVFAERFENWPAPAADCLTARALDRFTEMLTELIEWSKSIGTLLLFGGESLREEIEKTDLAYEAVRAPASERRFLFVVKRHTSDDEENKTR